MFKKISLLVICALFLGACSSNTLSPTTKTSITVPKNYRVTYPVPLSDSTMVIVSLAQQQQAWKNTKYVLGGTTKKGIDCSAFTQIMYRDIFGINIPRVTVDQANVGKKVKKSNLKAGDLVFFKTGLGPNGQHVGIYMKDGLFLHASSRGGVKYSSLDRAYWSRTFYQARRL